jgi:anti-sigma B factor antagonist
MKKPVSADVVEPGHMSSLISLLKRADTSTLPVSAVHDSDASGIVSASGELDLGTVESFRTQVAGAVASNVAHVFIDLRHVTFIDSTTLGVLVQAHKRLRAENRCLTINTQQGLVLRLFEITGLTGVLDIQD